MEKKITHPFIPDPDQDPDPTAIPDDPKNSQYKESIADYIKKQYNYIKNKNIVLSPKLFKDVDELWNDAISKEKFGGIRQCKCCGKDLTYNEIVKRGYDFPSTYIKDCDILFVGINPSYNCKKNQTMPNEHTFCYGNKLHEYCGFNEEVGEENKDGKRKKLGTKKGTYWGAHLVSLLVGKEKGRYVSWSATDLFFVRETTQNWLLNYTGKNLKEWDEFLVAQANIALEIVKEINPKVIVVANGGGIGFINTHTNVLNIKDLKEFNDLDAVGDHPHKYYLGNITLDGGQLKPIILVQGRFEGNDSIGSKNRATIAQEIAELL